MHGEHLDEAPPARAVGGTSAGDGPNRGGLGAPQRPESPARGGAAQLGIMSSAAWTPPRVHSAAALRLLAQRGGSRAAAELGSPRVAEAAVAAAATVAARVRTLQSFSCRPAACFVSDTK